MTVQLKRNDTKDTISYTLSNLDGSVVNLTGATVKFVMGKNKTLITNAAATITDAATGKVEYTLTETDTLVGGNFNAEFEVTFSDGKVKTYPSNGYILVNIQANVDKDKSTYIEDQIAYRISDLQVMKNEIQAQLDQFAVGATNAETSQARVEKDGTVNATLKARLDKKEEKFSTDIQTLSSQMAHIATKNRVNKKPLPNAECFYDNFKSRLDGNIDGQSLYSVIDGTGKIVNGLLEVDAKYDETRGTVINRNFNEGKIRFKVNQVSHPNWMVNFRHDLKTNNRYSLWSAGGNIEFGWQIPGLASAKILTTSPTENYYVEAIIPTLFIGAVIEFRIWGESGSRPTSPTTTYTLVSGNPILKDGHVSVQSITGTVTRLNEILVSTGLNTTHKPLKQAYFSGRWTPQIVNGVDVMTTINQGAEIYAVIENTSVLYGEFVINSDTNPYIVYSIDGGDYIRAQVTSGTMTLFSGLTYGKHIVKIVASGIQESDDVWNKGRGLCFKGFTVDLGGTITPYIPNNKPLMFIGDSITAGVNVFGTGATSQNNSGEKGFAHVCSDLLGALPIQIGFGSTGVIVAGSGNVPNCISYIDAMMNDKNEHAEFPTAIVMNHGTNDRWWDIGSFYTAYTDTIIKLKSKYPNTPIFCVVPLTLHSFASEIQRVATEQNCFYLDTTNWNVTTTDGVHPDVDGHAIAGQKLADFIKEKLGQYYFY